jgi:hypothetical protein
LSAALGLTLVLNKLDKHATAVFSGAIPPAITFLDPEKTFEATTNSLRDFIIALDKEKADHLRYKVEGDVVKIFITPYRTTITGEDLQFSQGEYNVDLVLALGVDNQDHLDGALESHGKILHDAVVVTLSAGDQSSDLGSIDWHDDQASSLCEMAVTLTDGLKSDKSTNLVDKQVSTALLTGIVASTDRFSNNKTSSKVMTVAAQLMAAGADQQLIAAKLQESHEINQLDSSTESSAPFEAKSATVETQTTRPEGGLSITHEQGETLDDIADKVKAKEQQEAASEAEEALAQQISAVAPVAPTPVAPEELLSQSQGGGIDWKPEVMTEPSLGGTLNATTEQAAEDSRREEEDNKNKTILSHSYLSDTPTYNNPINSVEQTTDGAAEASVDIFAGEQPPASDQSVGMVGEMTVQPPSGPTLAEIDAKNRAEALASPAPSVPVIPDMTVSLPQPPPLPDFSTLPPPTMASAYALDPTPEVLGDILAPQPPVQTPPVPPTPGDPSQFQIPGQQ